MHVNVLIQDHVLILMDSAGPTGIRKPAVLIPHYIQKYNIVVVVIESAVKEIVSQEFEKIEKTLIILTQEVQTDENKMIGFLYRDHRAF